MIAIIKNKTANFWFIVFITLVSINFWSFRLIDPQVNKALDMVGLACIIMVVVFLHRKKGNCELNFRSNVYLFMFLPILCCFGASIYHDESLLSSLFLIRSHFFWLFYFVLHILNIPKKQVINLMLFVGGVWIFLTLVQQVTYPHYYFYTRGESEDSTILRAGVYRFMLQKQQYGLFVILYCFNEYLTRQKLVNLVYVLFGLAGMYYFGARQYLAASMVCVGLSVLFAKGKAKLNALTMAFSAGVLLLFLKDALFGEYIKMTANQVENSETDIRMLSADFFLNEYWPSWVTKLIGNGPSSAGGKYQHEIDMMRQYYHFYRSDVGIIGTYNFFGLFYVLNIFFTIFKGLRNKYYYSGNRYLRLFFINALMLILLSEDFSDSGAVPFFCFVFYLIDKTYEEKKAGEESLA